MPRPILHLREGRRLRKARMTLNRVVRLLYPGFATVFYANLHDLPYAASAAKRRRSKRCARKCAGSRIGSHFRLRLAKQLRGMRADAEEAQWRLPMRCRASAAART